MFNVNWVGKGIRFNDDFSRPLSPNDSRILFLRNVVNWLDCWKNLPTVKGKLSPQTFTSLKHTCNALPILVDMLCTKYGFQYLLTSRIQNDPLEHHFGLYRQMSGSHYQISYSQILESERRLQLSYILKLFDIKTKSDTIHKPTLMEYLNTFSTVTVDGEDSHFELEKIIGEFHVKKPIISPPSTDWSEICCVVGHLYVFTFVKITDQSVMWFLSYDVTIF